MSGDATRSQKTKIRGNGAATAVRFRLTRVQDEDLVGIALQNEVSEVIEATCRAERPELAQVASDPGESALESKGREERSLT